MLTVPTVIKQINEQIEKANGKLYIVGGYVRDYYLNKETKDIDLEVFKLTSEQLTSILSEFGEVYLYKNFGVHVLSIDNIDYEFTICRRETKIGNKYTDFEIEVNPELDLLTASKRRDFTINALYYDITTAEVIDLHDSLEDLNNKLLRQVNKDTFCEDPLRVLRAMRFACELDFEIEEQTLANCLKISEQLKYISNERKSDEFYKIITSKYFSNQLDYIRMLLFKYLSTQIEEDFKLETINKFNQNLKYHPEGDVWTHTKLTIKAYEKIRTDEFDDFIVLTVLLFHDIGKVKDTYVVNGFVKNTGHEHTSYVFTKQFINQLVANKKKRKLILNLIEDHMIPFRLNDMKTSTLYKYLEKYKADISYVCLVSLSDKCGRRDDDYFNDKFSFLYDRMYLYWLKLYKSYEQLKIKYDGKYFINAGCDPKQIKELQKRKIVKELEKVRNEER